MPLLEEFKAEKLPAKKELERSFVLEKIKTIKDFFKSGKQSELRILANELIQTAVLRNDAVIARLCLIAYSLHKLLTKVHFIKDASWQKNKNILLNALDTALTSVREQEVEKFVENLDRFVVKLERVDDQLNNYIQSVYSKAKIKYAADAFYLGMSLGAAAALTGADVKDLQKYVSFTKQFEEVKPVIGINERLERLEAAIK